MGHEGFKLQLIEGLTKLEDDGIIQYLKVFWGLLSILPVFWHIK
jgi:hypothetical protein